MLRDAKSRAMHLRVAADRQLQVEEKEEMSQIEREQNEYFEQLWEQQRQKALERAKEEERIREEMKHQFRAILDKQVQQLDNYKADLEEIKNEEVRLLNEKWKLEEEEEKRMLQKKHEQMLLIRKQTDRFNAQKRLELERAMREERELDLQLLNDVLEREKQAEEAETMKKVQMREEAKQYQKWLLQQMQRDKEEEAVLDKLIQHYSEQQWQKRVDVWDREKRAREKLMQEVMDERKRQIQHRMDEAAKRREEAMEERERILQDIEQMYEEHKRDMQEQFDRQREQKSHIEQQIMEKKDREYQAQLELEEEYREQMRSEEQYMKMLQQDLEQLELVSEDEIQIGSPASFTNDFLLSI